MKKRKLINIQTMHSCHRAESLTCDANDVEINQITPIQFYHEFQMAQRRRELTESGLDLFKLTCVNDFPQPDEVSEDELEAEKVASHKRIILTDNNLNVIHGHENVLIAREQNEPILILKIIDKLSKESIFVLQVRHAAKEGLLFPAVRMEVIRTLVDDMKMDLKSTQLLLVNSKGKKPSTKEVLSELRVGRLFQENPGYKIPFTGFELDKHAFSNLKYLVGNNSIYSEMQNTKDKSEHFLRMAIIATKTRSTRLNTEIPKLMKFEDTRELLFNQGLSQSKTLLKAKYPEENQAQHPYNDLFSANQKLKNTEVMLLVKHQLDTSPSTNPLLRLVIDLNHTISDLSSNGRKEILRSLFDISSKDFVDVIIKSNPEIILQALSDQKTKVEKLIAGVK